MSDPKRAQLARAIVGAIDFLERRGRRIPADLAAFRYSQRPANVQTFAAPKAPRQSKALAAVNDYQAELQKAYEDWADDLADELADAPEDDRDEIIAAAVAALLLLLKRKGAENITRLATLGFGGQMTDAAKALAARNIAENESYLTDSLGPDLTARVTNGLQDQDVLAAIASGAGAAAISGLLKGLTARVGSYSGQAWKAYNQGVGEKAQAAGADETGPDGEPGKGKRVRWVLDPEVDNHCPDWLEFGNREYDSYQEMLDETGGMSPASGVQCQSNCRCRIEEID